MENFSGNTDGPYTIIDTGIDDNFVWEMRYFKNDDPSQLFWHRDREDREVEVIWGDVKVQLEDQLPRKLLPTNSIWISAERYHRVIADDSFILKIYKYKQDT